MTNYEIVTQYPETLTQKEYLDAHSIIPSTWREVHNPEWGRDHRNGLRSRHYFAVKRAIRDGKTVPLNVLEDHALGERYEYN